MFHAEPLYGVGSFTPSEILQQRFLGQLTVAKFFIRNKGLAELGLAGVGKDVLKLGLINIEVNDVMAVIAEGKKYEKTVRLYIGCIIHEYTETVRANAVSGENAVWLFRDCKIGEEGIPVKYQTGRPVGFA